MEGLQISFSFSSVFFLFQFIDGYCKNYSSVVCAVQKALKEKEEHIEQLLVERDLERAEFARMAARVDEVNFASFTIEEENVWLQWPTICVWLPCSYEIMLFGC